MLKVEDFTLSKLAATIFCGCGNSGRSAIKLLDFSLSSIGWRKGLARGGAFLFVSPLLGPLPARSFAGRGWWADAAV